MPTTRPENDATRLRELGALLAGAIETLASQWEAPEGPIIHPEAGVRRSTVSPAEFHASRVIHSALGSLESLVVPPRDFLISLSMSHSMARALHIVTEHNIAELLSQADDAIPVEVLAASTGLDPGKLRQYFRTIKTR